MEVAAGDPAGLVGRGHQRGGAEVPVTRGALGLRREGRGLGGRLTHRRVVLPAVTVQVRGAVKLFPAEEALVHVDVCVQRGVAVEVVSPVESFPAHLAEEPLVVRVRVGEDVPLELVGSVEPHPAHHAGGDGLLALARLCDGGARRPCSARLCDLHRNGASLDERESLAIQRVPVQDSAHEGAPGNAQRQFHHVVVLAGVNWSLELEEVLCLGEVHVGDGSGVGPAPYDGLLGVVVVGGDHDGRLGGVHDHGEEDGLSCSQLCGTIVAIDDRALDHLQLIVLGLNQFIKSCPPTPPKKTKKNNKKKTKKTTER